METESLENEEWAPFPDGSIYEISSYGRIRCSMSSYSQIINGHTYIRPRPSFYKTRISKGYEHAHLNKKSYLVHRLVAMAFLPNPENKREVNHKNSNKLDNRLVNLEWCTSKENKIHAIKSGKFPRGERIGNSKMTESQVLLMRSLYKTGDYTQCDLAFMFKINQTVVSDIVNKITWTHLNDT